MDPLAIFGEDIAPLILQHLSVRDILKSTLVSPYWNDLISSINTCTRKIWLRFYEPFDDVDCLMKSKRKYTSFKMQRGMPERLIPVFEKYRWKNIMMRDNVEIPYEKFLSFMKQIAPHIETLDLWDIGTTVPEQLNFSSIDFPNLVKLEINLTTRPVFSVFLGRNPKLKQATFRNEGMHFNNTTSEIMEPTNLIHHFLKNHPKIERLKLFHCEFAFTTDLTQGRTSNLKTLTVTTNDHLEPDMRLNVLIFIKSHGHISNIRSSRDCSTTYITTYY